MFLRTAFAIPLLAAALAATSAATAAPSLDDGARILADESGAKLRRYSTRDFGRERYDRARSVLVADQDRAADVVKRVRARLPAGLVAFVGTQVSLAENAPRGVEVVVAAAANPLDIVRIAATDGVNRGLDTEDIVAVLKKWHERYGIDIHAAQTDTIQLRLRSQPDDVAAFANEVRAFAPDSLEGMESVEAFVAEIARGEVFLFWD